MSPMSPTHTRRAHLSVPAPAPLPGELTRTHLLAELDAQQRRVVALIAPAGYGKTTLLGQLARAAHTSGQVVAWLTLTPDEADPARLAQELARTCAALPDFQADAFGAALAEGRAQSALAAALARDLNELPHNLLLVIDQTECLGAAGAAWLGSLLTQLGEGHRSALAGFDLGQLRLGRVLAQGGVHLLDSERLAFTDGEVEQFRQAHPGAHSDERWPLGLALSAAGLELGSTLTPQAYQEELLGTLPAEFDDLLDGAALLSTWTTAAFRALGIEPRADWAQRLLGAGLMLRVYGDGSCRPHDLLSAALRARLDGRPGAGAALTAQAAAQADAQGRPLEAARLYVQAGEPERATEVARRSAPALEESWAFDVLRQILETLPARTLPDDLRVKRCLCLLHVGEVVQAEACLRDLRDQLPVRAEALFLLSVIASRRGDSARQLALAEEGLRAAPGARVRTRLMRVQASALNVLGRRAEALPITQEALALAEDTAQHGERAHLLALLNALHAFARTPLPEREAVIRAAIRAYQRAGLPQACARLHASLAYLYRLHGQWQAAQDEVQAAAHLEQQHPSPDRCLVLEAQGDLHRAAGRDGDARAAYVDALAQADAYGITYVQAVLAYKLADLSGRTGDGRGPEWLTQARSWQYELSGSWISGSAHFYEGLLAAQRGDVGAAARSLRAAVLDPRLDLEEQVRARAWLLHLTPVAEQTLEDQTALADLRAFLGGDAALQLDLPFLTGLRAPEPDRPVRPDPAPAGPPAGRTGVPLQVRVLGGGVQVSVNGAPLRLAHSKPAELLAWLALQGPSTREQLVEALTDGGTEQRHVDYVKISVRRLRAALSEAPGVTFNPLEFRGGQYWLSEAFDVQVDALVVRQARHSHDPALLTCALDAYAGALLPRVESLWVETARLELEEDLITCALRLTELVRDTDPALAARACQQVLRLDPLQEDAARALVTLTQREGRGEEARHLARVYQRRLQEELRT